MFFDDAKLIARKRAILSHPPQIPATGWRPPSEFPNLSSASAIAFDTETKEDDFEHGPGWGRDKSHIVGVSVAARDHSGNRGKWYFPVRHEIETGYNLASEHVFGWLRHTFQTTNLIPKVGANLIYDIGNLTTEGIYVQGPLFDVQYAESILDENGFVALDHLGKKYLGRGKETSALYEWCAKAYGGKPTGVQRSNIWRAPPSLAGPYAEDDADMCLDILDHQWPLLARDGLLPVFDLECGLIPLMVEMRLAGVSIDLDAVERARAAIKIKLRELHAAVHDLSGMWVNVNAADDLARCFDSLGLTYPRTETGRPSFVKDFLKNHEHPIADLLNSIREHEKVDGTFLRAYLQERHVNGKVHGQFHQLKSEDGGAKTGRFSSSDPNLQNIPVRSEVGKKVRECFIGDRGHAGVRKKDYSQIEYRMLAHFAVGPGAEELRQTYRDDPTVDYHVTVQDNVKRLTGRAIDRRPIKNMNFGLLYGQGEGLLMVRNGFDRTEGKAVFEAYHSGAPYVKPTMAAIAQEVQQYGFVTTIYGRRTRFEMWEPSETNYQDRKPALPFEMAIAQYGTMIKRAFDYRGVNYKFQGSAADIMKLAMLRCYRSGVFRVTGVPRLTVHDELLSSVIDRSREQEEAYREMIHLMETPLQLSIPIRVDHKFGPNWGACE